MRITWNGKLTVSVNLGNLYQLHRAGTVKPILNVTGLKIQCILTNPSLSAVLQTWINKHFFNLLLVH